MVMPSYCLYAEEPKSEDIWRILEFKDKFGDPTGEFFLLGKFVGNFSNSAASYDDATISIRLMKDKFDFILFRYKSNPVREDEKYKISVKVKGKVYHIFTDKYLRIGFVDMLYNVEDLELVTFQYLLSLNEEMRFVIEEVKERELRETFRFSIPGNHDFFEFSKEISDFSEKKAFTDRNDYTEYYKHVYEKYNSVFAERLKCKNDGFLNSSVFTYEKQPDEEEFRAMFDSSFESDSLFESIKDWEEINYNNRPSIHYIRRKFKYDGIIYQIEFHKKGRVGCNISLGAIVSLYNLD